MDEALLALANRTRREILGLVWRDERAAGEIAAVFSLTRPAISQHLGVLRASNLVTVRRAGTRRLYRANRKAIAKLRSELGAFWEISLAQLKREAEAAEQKRRKG